MKTLLTLLIIGLMGVPALARPQGGASDTRESGLRQKDGERGERGERGRRDRDRPFFNALGQLGLSDAQKEQIKQIMQAHREQAKAWREANKEKMQALHEQLREARKAGDKTKAEQIREQIKALAQQEGGPGDLREDIKAILTDEQKEKLDEMRPDRRPGDRGEGRGGRGGRLKGIFAQLNLTDAQKEQVHAIVKAHHQEVQAFREANKEKLEQLREQIRQARQAKDREKMKQLMEQMRALREGGPSRQAMFQKIMGVLNAEQQAKLKEILENRPPRGEDGRQRPPRGPRDRGPRGGGEGGEGGPRAL